MDEGFSHARVLKEVSLLPDKVRISSGRRPVAMATGVIDRHPRQGQPVTQVLVVVTSGWSVMCFDHNLHKLWEANLQVRFSALSASSVSSMILYFFLIILLRSSGLLIALFLVVFDRRISRIMLTTERYQSL